MEDHQDDDNLMIDIALTMASTSSTTTANTTGATMVSQDADTVNPNANFFTRTLQEHNYDGEDVANCLNLLSSPPPSPNKPVVEVARTPGSYAYKCKTCHRGFSSIQALGGHRSKHKKPPKPRPKRVKQDVGVHRISTTLSLQIDSNQQTQSCNPSGSMEAANIHECSICGAAFASAQGLGGHMRRHTSMRKATTSTSSNSDGCQDSKKPETLLRLDLNNPPPIEDDHRNDDQVSNVDPKNK